MRKNLFLGLIGVVLLAMPGISNVFATDWFVPENDITGTIGDAKFITIGKKFAGDFCAGSRTGKVQGMVAVYTGSDPAAITQFIKDTTGIDPGTRLVTITKDSVNDCNDTDLGDIFKYTGTEQ